MAKLGRNDPCHCGSGRKYKRCCLRADEAAPAFGGDDAEALLHEAFGDRTAYQILKLMESPELAPKLKAADPARYARRATRAQAGAMTTEALVEQLATMGIVATADAFRAQAERHTSAWALSGEWLEPAQMWRGAALTGDEDDMLGLFAVELWRRYLPERPSFEQIDDWMDAGYDTGRAATHAAFVAACELWERAWTELRRALPADVRTLLAVDAVFTGPKPFREWIYDHTDTIRVVAERDPAWASRGLALCQALLARFSDIDFEVRAGLRFDAARFLVQAGRRAEGEAALMALVDELPDGFMSYAALVELWTPGDEPVSAANLERAIALLERALAEPVMDADEPDIVTWIENLRARLADQTTAATTRK